MGIKSDKPIIAAQFSSVHSPDELLQTALVGDYLSKITKEVPLDILILGWDEKPELFEFLTSHKSRLSDQVFLWYPFLSDYPGLINNILSKIFILGKVKDGVVTKEQESMRPSGRHARIILTP